MILFTNETVEVIRIVPMELDIINVNNDDESMILGIGVIDKFVNTNGLQVYKSYSYTTKLNYNFNI